LTKAFTPAFYHSIARQLLPAYPGNRVFLYPISGYFSEEENGLAIQNREEADSALHAELLVDTLPVRFDGGRTKVKPSCISVTQ